MACDVALAEEASPTVRFFTWAPPAVSLGWKQRAPEWLSSAEPIEVVERPTGGGIAFHGSDVSVAIIVPRALAFPLEVLMRSVCHGAARLCDGYGAEVTCVLEAHAEGRITYCLSQPSPYAILSDSRKLAGFALRRYPKSWLIQGSLLIRPMPAPLLRSIPDAVGQQLRMRAISLSEATHTVLDERTVAVQWAQHWSSWWHSDFTDFNMITPIPVMPASCCRGESTPPSTISV